MADEADNAQKINEEMYARGLQRARNELAGDGSKDCIDCGNPIPPARRKACPSAKRCIRCQQALENGRSRGCFSGHVWIH